jgi:hypothetical protein
MLTVIEFIAGRGIDVGACAPARLAACFEDREIDVASLFERNGGREP